MIDFHIRINNKDSSSYFFLAKIQPVGKSEVNPDGLLVSANVNVYGLRAEVEKYINGERAQQEINFTEEETNE